MNDSKLFTIFLTFSDHEVGIGQYESESPLDALKQFIELTEALEGYDREQLLNSIMPLVHIAHDKGVWSFYFDPDLMQNEWPGDNPVLGGNIVQTDKNAPIRSN